MKKEYFESNDLSIGRAFGQLSFETRVFTGKRIGYLRQLFIQVTVTPPSTTATEPVIQGSMS